jgi:hypothetical protein
MESVFNIAYIVFFIGIVGGIAYTIDTLWQAHKRGLARVRAYEARKGNKK